MKWYQNLYIGETARKKKKRIIWKINHNAGLVDVYVVTLAANGYDLFDIVSSAVLMQKAVRRNCPLIVGIACGYDEAVQLALNIALEVYKETGGFQVRQYLARKERKERN